jgi:hypothetical protein
MRSVSVRTVAKLIFISTTCLALLAAWVFYIGPMLGVWHIKRINSHLASLRDRAKASPPATNALNEMMRLMHSTDPWERSAAIGFLGQVGSGAEPAVDGLIQVLNGSDLYDARGAAHSLGEIGPGAKQAIPSLLKAVRTYPNADIGCFSATSLGQIADPDDSAVAAALEQASKNTNQLLAEGGTRALRALAARRQKTELTNGPAGGSR